MCSFIFSRSKKPFEDNIISDANFFAQKRGPDFTGIKRLIDRNGYHMLFVHNLLDISDKTIKQPFLVDDKEQLKILLFNGEIYNYKKNVFKSDTESLIPTISKSINQASSMLDGEYAIVMFDFISNELVIYTDAFLTKPLYFGFTEVNSEFGIASYPSSLRTLGFKHIEMAEPNSVYRVIFFDEHFQFKKEKENIKFELLQYQDKFDLWVDALLEAVKKRSQHSKHKPFVCLSSGYDSGAICLALNLLGIKYTTYSIEAGETSSIINERIKINCSKSCTKAYVYKGLSPKVCKQIKNEIRLNVEPFIFVHEDAPGVNLSIESDSGSIGGKYIARIAEKNGNKVVLSGSGADEIYSDYGMKGRKLYHHSEFGGVFPEDLSTIFPWKKFYGDTQRSYLFKEEFIFGSHGIEGRYPFLDPSVVQEFLSLKSTLKNLEYKAPLAYFLRKFNYPFQIDLKKGFNPYILPNGARPHN